MTGPENYKEAYEEEHNLRIALQMRDANGQTYTCYWNCSRDDMACMIDALHDDALLEFLRANKDVAKEILDGEEDDGDGN